MTSRFSCSNCSGDLSRISLALRILDNLEPPVLETISSSKYMFYKHQSVCISIYSKLPLFGASLLPFQPNVLLPTSHFALYACASPRLWHEATRFHLLLAEFRPGSQLLLLLLILRCFSMPLSTKLIYSMEKISGGIVYLSNLRCKKISETINEHFFKLSGLGLDLRLHFSNNFRNKLKSCLCPKANIKWMLYIDQAKKN
ncbi:hypothetical protein BpHYR1_010703 [Brachionus plicatilis]|uniref:Uncharacterized protein n=1 Tax=Brachionus plicatilis TaxID=10195 RepID=A0A3M7SKT3_BRAPC|nr:hypothetical protein BpHYR1_010703 [Brachionus plicatilis]